MKAFNIIKCVDILSSVKLCGKLFRVYLEFRRVAKPVLLERQDAIDRMNADWPDKNSEGYKNALKHLHEYVSSLYEAEKDIQLPEISVDDIISELNGSSVTNEQVAFICETLGL